MLHSARTLLALTLGLTVTGCGQAESAPSPDERAAEAPAARVPFVPTGATLTFAIVDEITTKTANAGDRFSARLVSDFIGEGGAVVLPAGSTLHGTVTESLESARNEEPAIISLAIASIETPAGKLNVVASVEQVEMETDAKDTNTLSAGKVAVGAAAGAILGKIAGRTKTGAAVGTAGGAALAIATRDGHATIPAGAQLVVRLSDRLSIR